MFKSISQRLIFNSVVVAIVTTFFGLAVLVVVSGLSNLFTLGDRTIAMLGSVPWLFEFSPEERAMFNMPSGFTIVVDNDGAVVYVENYALCAIGMILADCAPELAPLQAEQHVSQGNNSLVVLNMILGYRVISIRQSFSAELYILSLLTPALCLTVMSIPVAFVVAKLTTRKLAKRLQAITNANTLFANGDFGVRVNDQFQDDIGQIGQQFNSMADILEQDIHLLRDLAQANTRLVNDAEENAIQLERVRLSRELHDDIAQKLFSLSINSSTLPDLIKQDPQAGIQHARYIAQLAEQVNVDLRALLVDLRPVDVIRHGFSEALQSLCESWELLHHIPTTCTLVLQGKYIPIGIEDAVYRITQEALNNIAKHAHAKSVSVSVLEGQHQLTISITDDGAGFDMTHPTNGHFGVMGMQERARAVGGNLIVESDTGQGTTVKAILPIGTEHKHD
jgi:signal transduction histidine kinase